MKRKFLIIFSLVFGLMALANILKPSFEAIFGTTLPKNTSQPQENPQIQPKNTEKPNTAPLLVEKFGLTLGETPGPTWHVRAGKLIEITIKNPESNTETVELHLHGYDFRTKIAPNTQAIWSFSADKTGHFELEQHHPHKAIAALEVLPE